MEFLLARIVLSRRRFAILVDIRGRLTRILSHTAELVLRAEDATFWFIAVEPDKGRLKRFLRVRFNSDGAVF